MAESQITPTLNRHHDTVRHRVSQQTLLSAGEIQEPAAVAIEQRRACEAKQDMPGSRQFTIPVCQVMLPAHSFGAAWRNNRAGFMTLSSHFIDGHRPAG